jgi:hypothetical protein
MPIRRLAALLFAGAVVTAATLAAAVPAQATTIVKLVNSQSGKCLQPVNASGLAAAAIVQMTCNGSTAQQWTVTTVSSVSHHYQNRSSGLCLDARGDGSAGTPIQQWPCNTISNENWSNGISNNLLWSKINASAGCIASPGFPDGLPMELRDCNNNFSAFFTFPNG